MKFIELKDYVIAVDSIAYTTIVSNRILIQMKNETYPISAEYRTVAEAKEVYENIKEILLKPLDN
jgi:hypothetical protein